MRIKANFKSSLIEGQGLILFEESGTSTLWGGIYEQLIPLLDGSKSTQEIIEILTCRGKYRSSNIYQAIFLLNQKGYLSINTGDLDEGEAAFWSYYKEKDPITTSEKINNSFFNLINLSSVNDLILTEKLIKIGLKKKYSTHVNCALTFVLCNSYLDPIVIHTLQELRKRNEDVMIIRPLGKELLIGPIYKAKEKGCHNCLVNFHIKHNRARVFASKNGKSKTNILSPSISIDTIHEIAFSIAAHEALKYIGIKRSTLLNNVISFDSEKLNSENHRFDPFHNCSICNKIEGKIRYPLKLKSCPVRFTDDGGYRKISPEETMNKYGIHISKITGIVDSISELKIDIPETYVYMAGYNSTRQVTDINSLKATLRDRNGGKGKTKIQAQVSALCESIERYSNETQGDEIMINLSFNEMNKKYPGQVFHPNDVMHFSNSQFKNKNELNEESDNFNKIPNQLRVDKKINWSPVWSITNNCEKYLPSEFLYFANFKEKIAIPDSNGLSSGNTLEEAIIQGFFEVVERDCTAIWWYNRLSMPEVNLNTSNDPWIYKIRHSLNLNSRDLWCLDITNDLGIPCFAAISKLRNKASQKILIGLGCHFDPEIAIQRSITELLQMLGCASSLNRMNSNEIDKNDMTAHWLSTATIQKHEYLLPDKNKPKVDIKGIKNIASDDLLNDIYKCNDLIRNIDSEILVSDVTRAETSMPVVKVVVPKLRHFYARYAEGRLYDIPVKLGFLKAPKNESNMNPTAMFF